MDPLPIIASIAGIATAGTSLSKAIYHFISSTRGASREMADIARNISDLSCILSELRRVLQESADLCSRKLLRRIKSATRRISAIHDDIYELMDSIKGFQTFRWSLRRSEVQYKLTLIESHKTAIQLMLNILILAARTRKEAQSQVTQTTSASEDKPNEPASELPLLRQQSETLAYAASHCLVDLSENQDFETSRTSNQPKTDYGSDNDDATGQVQIRGHGSSDGTGRWLFELIFENYPKNGNDSETNEQDSGGKNESPASDRTDLVVRTPAELQIAIYEPGAGQILIDRLLADWTCLSNPEVTRTFVRKPETENVRPRSPASAQSDAVIRFKDAGMEEVIRQAFVQVEGLYQPVLARHYILMGPDGNMIYPVMWESTVEPGMEIIMLMSMPSSFYPNHKPNLESKKVKVPARRGEKLESKNKEPSSLVSFLMGRGEYKSHHR
ncbi:uncharacterized protein FMAN_11812 [Fusarium mangiferae]|uniref:Ubiquitin-like domain-containing protein n=1 Tax=Fusarium mangiferae TaxID=192010 RepID=A0A1L7U7H0_FUSMA|nr:uncharacterized protein FMAN_11812 [Fusarium mangiferae]CVL06680.1 uncharacterized protein FMAN_11812 [Fusarium mangiferae]